jgi:hypothetical protein
MWILLARFENSNVQPHIINSTMPPRLRPLARRLTSSQNTACSSPSLCTSSSRSKAFSSSSWHETRLRQSMWMWLDKQGENFVEPLEGSTNYLNAYDNQGRLKRGAGPAADDVGSKDGKAPGGRKRASEDPPLPPESRNDFRPFPINPDFISQSVTSEELREAVWSKVMRDGMSVKAVSASMGVEMSRVGAIVRLKEIEKDWLSQVSTSISSFCPRTPI